IIHRECAVPSAFGGLYSDHDGRGNPVDPGLRTVLHDSGDVEEIFPDSAIDDVNDRIPVGVLPMITLRQVYIYCAVLGKDLGCYPVTFPDDKRLLGQTG